jgi:uncharacterized tellurite resistance protein B-like protein
MLSGIKSFFAKNVEPAPAAAPEQFRSQNVPIAACALMLELAHADDEFDVEERAHLERALARHFDIPPAKVKELIALAEEERRQSVDLFQFTSLIASSYDEGQKMVLAEVMWGLVYSDGKLSNHESYIMRKLSNLLGLAPGYLNEARRRAAPNPPNSP